MTDYQLRQDLLALKAGTCGQEEAKAILAEYGDDWEVELNRLNILFGKNHSVVKRVTADHPDSKAYPKGGITIKSGLTYTEAYDEVTTLLPITEEDSFKEGDLLFYKDSVLLEIEGQRCS
jgi:hypothetical protein